MIKFFKYTALAWFGIVIFVASYGFVPPPRQASAQFVDQSTFGGNSGGSANAQTITIGNYTAHTAGVLLRFVPGFTNTGPMQINVSGLGLVNVSRPSSIGVTGLSGGEVQSGELTCVVYNGSTYQLACNVDMTKIGQTIDFRGPTAPRGSLIEDGSCISRTLYASLFSVIGTTYGACDGSTTFGLSDSRGTLFAALDNQGVNGAANRITSAGSGCTATAVGLCGSQNWTLTAAQIPTISSSATPTLSVSTATNNWVAGNAGDSTGVNPGGTGGAGFTVSVNSSPSVAKQVAQGSATGTVASSSTNTSGQSHPTLPPVSLGRRAIKY